MKPSYTFMKSPCDAKVTSFSNTLPFTCTFSEDRRLLRDFRGKYKLPVVYSVEDARKQAVCPSPEGGKPLIGTVGYYTTTFGCYLAAYAIENL